MAVEAELKLGLPQAAAEQVLEHPLIERMRVSEARTKALSNTYYDTPELTLLDRGVGLRLRQAGERWLQTVKTSGKASGGLHQRHEWEMEVAGPALELTRLDAPELDGLLQDPDLQARLGPLFTTEFARTAVELADAGGSRLELALDYGAVRSERGTTPISEVEIELLEGDVAALFDVGVALARDLPLTLEHRSKAARGYAFFRPQPPSGALPLPELALDASLASAWEALLGWGVAELQGAESALLEHSRPAHGERLIKAVGSLQSLLELLAPSQPETEELCAEVTWLERRIAPLRHWDALLSGGLGALTRHSPEVPGLPELVERCQALREQQANALRTNLRDRRYTLMLLRLGRWLACRPWTEAFADAPFAATLARVLTENEPGLRRRGRPMRELKPEALRSLRKTVRQQWHGSRWLATVRSSREAWLQVTTLGRLHETMEHLHGAEQAAALLDELAEVLGKPSRGLLGLELKLCRRGRREAAQAAWERQREQARFWRNGERP